MPKLASCAGFPSGALVGWPLIYLSLAALLMVAEASNTGQAALPRMCWLLSDMIVWTVVIGGAISQLIWVPIGIAAMLTVQTQFSAYSLVVHCLALCCGVLQIALLAWLGKTAVLH